MSFLEGELAIINHHAKTGLPSRIGEICTVEESLFNSINYDYLVRFEDGETAKVKEQELNNLNDKQKELITYLYHGNEVLYIPTNEVVKVLKVDLLYGQIEVEFDDAGLQVVIFDTLKKLEKESESMKSDTNENLINIFFNHYKNQDGSYTVPKEVLINLLDYIFED